MPAVPRKSGGQHSTLHDVALAAGVSVSTAARVLRGSDYPVADELQQRVRAAAERLRYVPNLLAKRLRGGAHPSIGLIVGNMLDPYFGEIAQAVTVAAQRRSLLAIVANMQRDPQLELGMIRELWEHRVNGLILAGGGFDQITYKNELASILRQVRRSGITVVSLARRGLPLPVFSVDNEAVGVMLAEHALAHGHREIAIAAGPVNSHVTQERLKGSRRVLAQAGLKPVVVHGEFGVAGGVDAIDRLLADNPGLTMVLANADTLGVGILRGLAQRDLRVPDDVSVISAGNTAYARLCTPALTTMDIALAECCEAAVQYVSDNMGRADPAGEPRPFGAKLMPGMSVRTIAPELSRGRVRAI